MPRKPENDYDMEIINKLYPACSIAQIARMKGWNPKSTESFIRRNYDVIKIAHFIPKEKPKKSTSVENKKNIKTYTKDSFLNEKDMVVFLDIINIAEELKQFDSYYHKTYGKNEIKEADDLHTRLTRELK